MGTPQGTTTQSNDVPLFDFSGGLDTDATATSAEGNTVEDLTNIELFSDKSIRPRRAIDFISAGNHYKTITNDLTSIYGEYVSSAPSSTRFNVRESDGSLRTFCILVVSPNIYIYELDYLFNISDATDVFQTIDISSYSNSNAIHYKTRFIKDSNRIYLLNSYIEFSYLEYNTSTRQFDFSINDIFVRDIDSDNPPEDSYRNNDGKSYKCIKSHTSSATDEPGVGANWRIYWALNGAEISGGTAWALATDYTSNIVSYKDEYFGDSDSSITKKRFNLGVFSSGRLWLSGLHNQTNTIFFSQTITEDIQSTRMYQFADPFNADDNLLVDTDGGTIEIKGAEIILGLAEIGQGVVVLANNGIWFIQGSSGGFLATDYSVDKISSEGCIGQSCFVEVESGLVFFSNTAAYAITFGDIATLPQIQKISDRIDSFYTSIPVTSKVTGMCHYNKEKKQVFFFTNFNSSTWLEQYTQLEQPALNRDILVYDVSLNSWFKYSLEEDTNGSKVAISDVFTIPSGQEELVSVVDESEVQVVDESSEEVAVISTTAKTINTILVVSKVNGNNADIAFVKMDSDGTTDFSLGTSDSYSFEAELKTHPIIFNDLRHRKYTPNLVFLFERMEQGIIDETTNEDVYPGGCLLRVSRDFAVNSKAFRFGESRQVYFPNRFTTSYHDGSDPGIDHIWYKTRLRGSSKAVQFRIIKDGSKDFKLIGMQLTTNYSRRV